MFVVKFSAMLYIMPLYDPTRVAEGIGDAEGAGATVCPAADRGVVLGSKVDVGDVEREP